MYLDMNHLIELARARVNHGHARPGYSELLDATRRAGREQRAVFPLSGQHLSEVSVVKNPRQRRDVADVMEELSGFNYLLGRPEIAQLEVEAGIEDIFGEPWHPVGLPLVRATFGHAFGICGGMSIRNADGSDGADAARRDMGEDEYDRFIRSANHTVERAMLDGPSDEEVPVLRAQYGYAPEKSREGSDSRLAFELALTEWLAKNPRWRHGRLRDVVSAREVAHEWLDAINRVNEDRARRAKRQLDRDDDTRRLLAAMPHSQVAISIKTHYHRNPKHKWETNDITDIDAASVAYAYCDAVFTDKAVRAALANATELRPFGTYLPRTPQDLSAWLDDLPSLAVPDMLLPASSAASLRAQRLRSRRGQ
ncbi:MAG: hypothetical protein V9G08_04080 [Dermatophilaceae bacterium]